VAVLHLQGPIVLEESGRSPSIQARKVLPILRRLREDEGVGAVVLHVDSPGGSALASDLMWREVDQLRRSKPVVAAFEDVAASGGYYLSAPAQEIVARPTTLTGSIGVFGGKLVMAEGLRKVGVHSQEILGAPNANLFSPSRHFTADQRQRFKASLQRFYDGFVERVADGRGVDEDEIEPHCRGRVWTGRAALERKLVDRHGDLEHAVDRARILAGLTPGAFLRQDISGYRPPLMSRLAQRAMRTTVAAEALGWAEQLVLGPVRPLLEVVARHQGQVLAMLPFDLRPR
jgi:protease-4